MKTNNSQRSMKFRKLTGAVLAVTAGAAVHAAAWEFSPILEAGYLFDDNYRLTVPGTEIEVNGPLADVALEIRAITQANDFSITPRIRSTYFPNDKELDATDYFTDLDWQYRGQRVRTRVQFNFAQQDIVNSEQPDAEVGTELGESDFGDAGRVLVSNRRTRYVLRPSLNYELSARRELQFELGATDVSFDREIVGAQVDYTTMGAAASIIFRNTERSSWSVRTRAGRYENNFTDPTTALGAEVQWDSRTAADTRTFVRFGAENVELVDGQKETAWIAGGGVSFQVGRNELFTDLSRSIGPSSAGLVIARDQLRARWTRDMTPRLALLAGLRGTHDDAVDSDSLYQARTYLTGDVGLQWRWQEEFSLRVVFDYTWQDFENGVDNATSTGAMVSVTYQPVQRPRR
jgi:hypothetical protein